MTRRHPLRPDGKIEPMFTPVLCRCGCGEPAPIAKKTASRYGHIKGQPTKYVAGHTSRRRPVAQRLADGSRMVDSCLEWQRSKVPKGYGYLTITTEAGVSRQYAHRLAWELVNGSIPDGMHVLHHCDNPPCIRVDHLFLGTQRDNIHDMWAKGRGVVPDPRKGQPRRRAA